MGSFPQPFPWLVWSAPLLVALGSSTTFLRPQKSLRFYTKTIESIRPPNLKDEFFLSPKLSITTVENDDVPREFDGIWLVFPTLFSDISPEGSVSRPMLWVPWQRPRFHGKTDQKTAERCRRLRLGQVSCQVSLNHPPLEASWIWVPQNQPPPTISTVLSRSTVIWVVSSSIIHHILKHHPTSIRSSTRSSSTQHEMSASSADTDSSCVNTRRACSTAANQDSNMRFMPFDMIKSTLKNGWMSWGFGAIDHQSIIFCLWLFLKKTRKNVERKWWSPCDFVWVWLQWLPVSTDAKKIKKKHHASGNIHKWEYP